MSATMYDTSRVIAEDAPLGVQLWPTLSPEGAANFTLARVETVRDQHHTFVRWVYQSGETRTFRLGERVVVKLGDS